MHRPEQGGSLCATEHRALQGRWISKVLHRSEESVTASVFRTPAHSLSPDFSQLVQCGTKFTVTHHTKDRHSRTTLCRNRIQLVDMPRPVLLVFSDTTS